MSYLLDAIRKSDHDRQIGQVPTLEAQPVRGQPSQRNHWMTVIIVLLVIINSIIVGYVFFVDQSSSQRQSRSSDMTESHPARKTVKTAQHNPPVKPAPAQKPSTASGEQSRSSSMTESRPARETVETTRHDPPIKPALALKPPTIGREPTTNAPKSIAEMIAAETKPKATATQQPVRTVRVPKTQPTKMPALPAKQSLARPVEERASVSAKEKSPKRSTTAEKISRDRPPSAIITTRKAPQPTPAARSTAQPAEATPLLDQLPRSFRRELPTMTINVFVYSKQISERFVIINMKKYKTGDKTMEGPLLEAIRPNSVVLRFEGQRFRLKRP